MSTCVGSDEEDEENGDQGLHGDRGDRCNASAVPSSEPIQRRVIGRPNGINTGARQDHAIDRPKR